MKILSITLKDLQVIFRDRGTLAEIFVLPLVFILVYTGAIGAIGGGEQKDERIALKVADLDGGTAAQSLMAGIDRAGGVRVETIDEAAGLAQIDQAKLARMLVIPQGFSADLAAGKPAVVRLVCHPNASPEQTEAVRLVLEGVASDLSLEVQILSALERMGEMQAAQPGAEEIWSVDRAKAQARAQFARAETQPLVEVTQRVPARQKTPGSQMSMADAAVPGFTVLFLFLTAQKVAYSIYEEKKTGSFRRLLAAPIRRSAMLLGKMLPAFLTGICQAVVIFAFGIWGLRLLGLPGITLGAHPWVTVLVVILVALCASALGILLAALAHTENQIGGLSQVVLWGMGILGGCIIPLFVIEPLLGPLPKVIPHYWANKALVDTMVRGLGPGDVWPAIAVLAGFAVLFFAIGTWRFDWD